jgi:hypothetical protein
MTAVDGDLGLAREYLERVAASNSEEVGQTGELLKKVKSMIMTKAQIGAEVVKTTGEAPVDVVSLEAGDGPLIPTD